MTLGPEFQVLSDGTLGLRGPRAASNPYTCNGLLIDAAGLCAPARPWAVEVNGSTSGSWTTGPTGATAIVTGGSVTFTNPDPGNAAVLTGIVQLSINASEPISGEPIPAPPASFSMKASLSVGTRSASDIQNFDLPNNGGMFRGVRMGVTLPVTVAIPAGGQVTVPMAASAVFGTQISRQSSWSVSWNGLMALASSKGV